MQTGILAIDSGTSSCRALVFGEKGQLLISEQADFEQSFPHPAWVEHDGELIWKTQESVLIKAVESAKENSIEIKAVGLTNQRETCIAWSKSDGLPFAPAIVWQDKRTASSALQLREGKQGETIKKITGLISDSYFSATKMEWLLHNHPEIREQQKKGNLCLGTIDSFLIYRLCGQRFITDPSNASRTMLYDIHKSVWDESLLDLFSLKIGDLPKVVDSYGELAIIQHPHPLLKGLPLCSIAGDQQAALFGQQCITAGQSKNTYGTGCFLLTHCGTEAVSSQHGLLTTRCVGRVGSPEFALEGSVFMAGALIQWLRDSLQLIKQSSDSEIFAGHSVLENEPIIVPAFTGLGTPHWDSSARGLIIGLSRASGKNEICAAVLKAIAYQCDEVIDCMQKDLGSKIQSLKVDGGACMNNYLMDVQASVSETNILRPENRETTALGAAMLAGLATGFWSREDLGELNPSEKTFQADGREQVWTKEKRRWKEAVERSKGWANYE